MMYECVIFIVNIMECVFTSVVNDIDEIIVRRVITNAQY